MQLVDFGPDEMTNATRSINAEKALQDPLPQVGAKATEGHGTGAAAAIPLPNWTWVVAGRMPMPTLSLFRFRQNSFYGGVLPDSVGGTNGAVLAIPPGMVGANINLTKFCFLFA